MNELMINNYHRTNHNIEAHEAEARFVGLEAEVRPRGSTSLIETHRNEIE